MRGKPKFLNTKEDYMNILKLEDSIMTRDDKIQAFEDLLANTEEWMYTGVVSEEDKLEDDEHKVVPVQAEEGEIGKFHQYVLTTNTGARIFKLDFTKEEVEQIIANLRANSN